MLRDRWAPLLFPTQANTTPRLEQWKVGAERGPFCVLVQATWSGSRAKGELEVRSSTEIHLLEAQVSCQTPGKQCRYVSWILPCIILVEGHKVKCNYTHVVGKQHFQSPPAEHSEWICYLGMWKPTEEPSSIMIGTRVSQPFLVYGPNEETNLHGCNILAVSRQEYPFCHLADTPPPSVSVPSFLFSLKKHLSHVIFS